MLSAAEIQTVPGPASGNVFLNALTFGEVYAPGTVIDYVFQGNLGDTAGQGGVLWSTNGLRSAFNAALATWSAVANVTFLEAAGPYDGTGPTTAYDWIEQFQALEAGIAGQHDLPFAGTLTGTFNSEASAFTQSWFGAGSNAFAVLVHEIGHGLGLLHPHNDGGDPPGDPAFPGVTDASSLGDFGLNQGLYTVMTYNSGFAEVGLPVSYDFGWESGPMAFDIAAVQRLYGANATTNLGDTTFVLPGANVAGTGWRAIWDTGGGDTLSAGTTSLDAVIDLRAATLLDAPGGGGFLSRVGGVMGGLTIANGVVIETARGSLGNDLLHGNAANNLLDGGAGRDTVAYTGVSANLTINLASQQASGDGNDMLVSIESAIGGNGNDTLVAMGGVSAVAGAQDVIKTSVDHIDTRAAAMDLDYRFASRAGDPAVEADPGMASVTVHAQGSGTADNYAFYVTTPGSVIIDIDASYAIDAMVRVYDSSGALLGSNDDRNSLDPGSANRTDSYLSVFVGQGGQRITVEVSDFDKTAVSPGASYDLTISLQSPRLASGAILLGSRLDGGAGGDRLVGGAGWDELIGGAGVDTAVVAGNRSAYTVSQPATGAFTVTGPDGTDTLSGVEYLKFADQTLRLLPGSGTAVNFASAPSAYMAGIRDFDGNDLGGASGWKLIGSADVNGDGDADHILVNRTIARFAELGTAPDGLVYFADHGWAGETRVVGIYIDPLVQSGEVAQGGPFDSQRRFQNDLAIENINRVLGSGDYDRDGLQEVYFGLTDGTAYLHAYMHADGNIRYANYQSQQQVMDYLTGQGWAASTWDHWFG